MKIYDTDLKVGILFLVKSLIFMAIALIINDTYYSSIICFISMIMAIISLPALINDFLNKLK